MEHWKKYFRSFLFPGWRIVLPAAAASAAMLIYIFINGYEECWIAYGIYAFSAYALTIFCAGMIRVFRCAGQELSNRIEAQPILHRYVTDPTFRVKASLYFSFAANVLYAVLKFGYGFYFRSVWFGTLAVYYFLLAVMRFALLQHLARNDAGTKRRLELKWYLFCGIFLLLMNIALAGVVVLVVCKNEGFEYAGYLIYAIALYDFYNIVTAVCNMIQYRKYQSPVMSAAKVLSFASALVSMLSLETAMLAQFNENADPEAFRRIMTACTGGGVCSVIFGTAVFMICRAVKEFKMERNNDTDFSFGR